MLKSFSKNEELFNTYINVSVIMFIIKINNIILLFNNFYVIIFLDKLEN